jgi:hypothetical protein
MARKLWTAPGAQFLTGDDGRLTRTILTNLNEYFKRHIGFWGKVSGTTDVNGDFTITHNCGFEPAVVLLTEQDAGDPSKMGPFHIETYDSSIIRVHLFHKNGSDRGSENVTIHYLLLPKTGER